MKRANSISVIIPTFNEENYILDALQSVAFADEIIIIDSYSTDNTVSIAKPLANKILQRKFDNFSNQKNEAIKHATGDWILFLDADERISKELQQKILLVTAQSEFDAYKLTFKHYYMDRFLDHHTDKVLRLVKNHNLLFTGKVHEHLSIEGTIGTLKEPVYHYTYKGFLEYLNKKVFYSTFQAQQHVDKDKPIGILQLWLKPYFRYLKSAYLKQGRKDGIPGITVARINSYGVFLRLVKALIINGFSKEPPYQSTADFDDFLKKTHEDAKSNAPKCIINESNLIMYTRFRFLKSYLLEGKIFQGKKGYIESYLKAQTYFMSRIFAWLDHKGLK